MKPAAGAIGLGISAGAIIAAVVTGLVLLGSPREERARRLDGRRVTDLRAIAHAIDLYWTRHTRLPASLEELAAEPGVTIRTADPTSQEGYGYRTVDSLRYEVCAAFDRQSEAVSRIPEEAVWAHGAGRQCFQLEAEAISRSRAEGPGELPAGRPRDPEA